MDNFEIKCAQKQSTRWCPHAPGWCYMQGECERCPLYQMYVVGCSEETIWGRIKANVAAHHARMQALDEDAEGY